MQSQVVASHLDTLVRLNDDYIESVKTSNVGRFREILADDFLGTLPDGSFVDRDQFLEFIGTFPGLGGLQAHDVAIRVMGDVAIVQAGTTFTLADGTPGAGRYTDVWAQRNGQWLAVAAHVTRQEDRPPRARG